MHLQLIIGLLVGAAIGFDLALIFCVRSMRKRTPAPVPVPVQEWEIYSNRHGNQPYMRIDRSKMTVSH